MLLQRSREDLGGESDMHARDPRDMSQPGLASNVGSSSRSNYGVNDPLMRAGASRTGMVIREEEESKFIS